MRASDRRPSAAASATTSASEPYVPTALACRAVSRATVRIVPSTGSATAALDAADAASRAEASS